MKLARNDYVSVRKAQAWNAYVIMRDVTEIMLMQRRLFDPMMMLQERQKEKLMCPKWENVSGVTNVSIKFHDIRLSVCRRKILMAVLEGKVRGS